MGPTLIISGTALALSALTIIATQLADRRSGSRSYVTKLEARVKSLETDLDERNDKVAELESLNFRLLKQLYP